MSFHTGKSLAKIGENKQKRAEVFFVFVFFIEGLCTAPGRKTAGQ